MTYTPNVPQGGVGQTLDESRPLINANFAVIQTSFDQDHIDFNASGAGKHKAVHYPAAATPTQAGTLSGEIALYSKLDAAAVPRLTFREPSNGIERQISGNTFSGQGALTNGGAIPLFGGFIMLFGQVTSGTATISFLANCGMKFPKACFVVVPTFLSTVGAISVNTVTASGFNIVVTGSSTISFVAIGY